MYERENIITHLKSLLWDVPGVKLVTRFDHRSIIGSLQEYPAICIVDTGDEPENQDSRYSIRRHLTVALVSVFLGSTEDTAASEIATFQRYVKKQVYSNLFQCEDVKGLIPLGISSLFYAKVGSRVVVQGLDYEIKYVEDIRRLLAGVQPTQ